MNESNAPTPKDRPGLKRLAVISFFVGLGVTVGLAGLFGVWAWLSSRPTPPPKWDEHSLVVKEAPSFSAHGDTIGLIYSIRNTTDSDYSADGADRLRLFTRRMDDSTLVPQGGHTSVFTPIDIPAKESGVVLILLADSDLPRRRQTESDSAYHETVRGFLNSAYSNVESYVLYDDGRRLRLLLPRWQETAPP